MLIAHLTRSGGLSIGINVMLMLGGSTAAMVLVQLTKKEFFMTYWLLNIQSEALNYANPIMKQGRFVALLLVIGVVFTALGVARFKMRDVD